MPLFKLKTMSKQKVLATEVALVELTKFVKKHKAKEFRRGKITEEQIPTEYIDILESLEDGNLEFDENLNPKYTLMDPVLPTEKNADASLGLREITFKTRIKPTSLANIMQGIDVQKDSGTFSLKYMSYITGLSLIMIDKLSKDDYDVLNQICSVF